MRIDELLPRDEINLVTKTGRLLNKAQVIAVKRDRLQVWVDYTPTTDRFGRDRQIAIPKYDVASVKWLGRKADPFAKVSA